MRILVFTALLVSSLVIVTSGQAEIYWDREKSFDPTITDKDFKLQYGSSKARSFGDQEIYDSYKTETSDKKSVVAIPEAEAPVVAPQTVARPETRRPSLDRQPAGATDKVEAATPRRDRTGIADTLKRTDPVVNTQDSERTRGTPVPAVAGEPDSSAAKKLKWGKQEETAAPEETELKTKFNWGKR